MVGLPPKFWENSPSTYGHFLVLKEGNIRIFLFGCSSFSYKKEEEVKHDKKFFIFNLSLYF
jgi:hypothetical protein